MLLNAFFCTYNLVLVQKQKENHKYCSDDNGQKGSNVVPGQLLKVEAVEYS